MVEKHFVQYNSQPLIADIQKKMKIVEVYMRDNSRISLRCKRCEIVDSALILIGEDKEPRAWFNPEYVLVWYATDLAVIE